MTAVARVPFSRAAYLLLHSSKRSSRVRLLCLFELEFRVIFTLPAQASVPETIETLRSLIYLLTILLFF